MGRAEYERYLGLREELDELGDALLPDLRSAGEAYVDALRRLGDARGRPLPTSERFPMTVARIEARGDQVVVEGSWTRFGATDEESCALPRAYLMADDESRRATLEGLEGRIREAIAVGEARARADRRALHARLGAEVAAEAGGGYAG